MTDTVLSPPAAAPASAAPLPWQHSFATLGEEFFTPVHASPLPQPHWVAHSASVAHLIGLPEGWQHSDHWLHGLAGNLQMPGTHPIASVYSGHQFGVWAGQLGDGRALLLGNVQGYEVQLKGAGRTPYSRMGDGRAVLRSSIREFLCSEAMHGLGIPTTRALSIVGSPASVVRESVETAAVVARVAPSFIRFGHFEHFCHHDKEPELQRLADYVIDTFYPECRLDTRFGGNPYAALLAAVTERTARLMAQWQSVGFCHGVMNTDNMSILGLTIDYGPFQFLDAYDPAHICNHSDHSGRYAYQRQPGIAHWNLYALGQALLPLIDEQQHAIDALDLYKQQYPAALAQQMGAKLGFSEPARGQEPLLSTLLALMATDRVDYTIFWRRLSHWAARGFDAPAPVVDLFLQRDQAAKWLADYEHLARQHPSLHSPERMLRSNPKYVLRNHLGQLAIQAAQEGDFSQVHTLLHVLQHPFDEHPEHDALADFAPAWASSISISCSS